MSTPESYDGTVHPKPGLFLFDFDGTLADTRSIAHEILNEMSREFGFRVLPPEELDAVRLLSTRAFIKHLGISNWRVPQIAHRGLQLLHERIHLVEPIAGMPEVLHELSAQGERLAILTSNSEANVEAFLKRHNLPRFQFVKSSSKLFGKAREIRRILKAEKLPPEQVLYIGDETRDIEAAKETGLQMVAVSWGYNAADILLTMEPDHLIQNPRELIKIFQGTTSRS